MATILFHWSDFLKPNANTRNNAETVIVRSMGEEYFAYCAEWVKFGKICASVPKNGADTAETRDRNKPKKEKNNGNS